MVARHTPSWVAVSGRQQIRAFSLGVRHIGFRRARRKEKRIRIQRVRKQGVTGDASSYCKVIDMSYKYVSHVSPQPVHGIAQLHLSRFIECYLCRDSSGPKDERTALQRCSVLPLLCPN